MNKALYIVGIVLSIVFFLVSGYYMAEVSMARTADFLSSLNSSSYDYYSYSTFSSQADDLTMEAGLISLFFFLVFIAIDLLGLLKVKTKVTKVMSIVGLSITALFLMWDFAVLSSPGSLSFDEVGVAWILYSFIMLAFCIVGLIQSVRFSQSPSSDPLG